MFDWDQDYDDLIIEKRPVPNHQDTAESRGIMTMCRRNLTLFVAGLVCIAGASTLVAHKAPISPDLAQIGLIGSMRVADAGPPVDYQALESDQRIRFLTGLRSFSDAELIRYARITHADHAVASAFMQPYLTDALALIEHEIARRGI